MSDTDNPITDVVDTVEETVVPDAVTETADNPVPEPPPEWAEELIEKVEEIADKISGADDGSATGGESHEPVIETVHDHGIETVEDALDDSPASVPWTHRNPFKRSE